MRDPEAWAEALRHQALLLTVVREEQRKSDDFTVAELMSYAWEGLYFAVKNFDPKRNKNFDAFAQRCIRNEIADGVNREYRQLGARVADGNRVLRPWPLPLDVFHYIIDRVEGARPHDIVEGFSVEVQPRPRDRRIFVDEISHEDPDPFEIPETTILSWAIAQLPPDDWELVRLYFFSDSEGRVRSKKSEGLTIRELAKKFGVSKATIQRRLDEALEFLRYQMEAMS